MGQAFYFNKKKYIIMKKGFTLIEVLVSVALLAIVLTILLRMEMNSVSLTAQNHIGLKALSLASNETDKLMKTSSIVGEYNNLFEQDPFKAKDTIDTDSFDEDDKYEPLENFLANAQIDERSDTILPLDLMTVKVLYGNKEYAEIKTFRVRFF